MIFVRLARGVTDHFPARRSEWALAAMLFSVGLILIHPAVTFDESPGYRGMKLIASENVWGWGCLLIGWLRLFALFLNGTFSHTHYGHWSPHVRGAMAFLSILFWAAITVGLFLVQRPLFGLGIFPFLMLLDITNVHQAFLDAGQADRGARDGDDT